jgi:hypothetical protein
VAEVEADDGLALQAPEELNDALRQDVEFWNSVAAGLRLDDVLQPPPRRGGRGWIKLPLPLGCHITGYHARLGIGVYLSLKNAKGIALWNTLHADQEAISRELPPNTEWTSYPEGGGSIMVRRNYKDVLEPSVAEEQKEWIRENLNCFVNGFRHRIATAATEGIAGWPI